MNQSYPQVTCNCLAPPPSLTPGSRGTRPLRPKPESRKKNPMSSPELELGSVTESSPPPPALSQPPPAPETPAETVQPTPATLQAHLVPLLEEPQDSVMVSRPMPSPLSPSSAPNRSAKAPAPFRTQTEAEWQSDWTGGPPEINRFSLAYLREMCSHARSRRQYRQSRECRKLSSRSASSTRAAGPLQLRCPWWSLLTLSPFPNQFAHPHTHLCLKP